MYQSIKTKKEILQNLKALELTTFNEPINLELASYIKRRFIRYEKRLQKYIEDAYKLTMFNLSVVNLFIPTVNDECATTSVLTYMTNITKVYEVMQVASGAFIFRVDNPKVVAKNLNGNYFNGHTIRSFAFNILEDQYIPPPPPLEKKPKKETQLFIFFPVVFALLGWLVLLILKY